MKSTRYRELHRVNWTTNWVFRKYSAVKKKEFVASTGIEAKDSLAAQAYKIGAEKFSAWLADTLPSGRHILIKDIARALKVAKSQRKKNTLRSFTNQVDNHVIPAFGHLRPEQITSLRWEQYDAEERRRGKRKKLFNTRKALREILKRAHEEGLIKTMPKLKNFDPPAAPPRYMDHKTYAKIRRELPDKIKLLAFVMYHQGARPTEILQYRWDMIRWGDQPRIHIPGEITKTGRARSIPLNSRVACVLARLARDAESDWIFPNRDVTGPLSTYNAVWDRAMDRLGMDYDLYNLRDTFITNRLKRGISATFIGKYCDTSAEMIERKYAVPEENIMRRVAG